MEHVPVRLAFHVCSAPRSTYAVLVPPLTKCKMRSTRPTTSKRRSEEHTSELQSRLHLVCRLLLEKKNYSGRGQQARRRAGSVPASVTRRPLCRPPTDRVEA